MSEDEAISHYVGDAGRQYHEGKRSVPDAAVRWIAKLRAEKIAPHINSSDNVFEFGVGSGWNLAQLQCARRVGYDVSDFLAPVVEKLSIEFVSETKSIPGCSFDLAICHHTLEHVLHPPDALREIHRILRPGGKLLLFVPHERERKYRRYHSAEPNHHLYSWNVQTLGNLVGETGFQLREGRVERFGYDRFAAKGAARFNSGETGFRLIRAAMHLLRPASEVRVVAVKK